MMEEKNEFEETMSKQTDSKLVSILNSPLGDYQPEAIVAAKRELEMRSLSKEQITSLERADVQGLYFDKVKADQPLSTVWKFLSFILPGFIPLIVAWSFKADGYNRKAKEVVKWTFYGFGFYFILVILNILLRKVL